MPTLNGLITWLGGPVLTVILLFAAVMLLSRGHKGNLKDMTGGIVCILLGLLVLGVALTGNAPTIAKGLANAVFA